MEEDEARFVVFAWHEQSPGDPNSSPHVHGANTTHCAISLVPELFLWTLTDGLQKFPVKARLESQACTLPTTYGSMARGATGMTAPTPVLLPRSQGLRSFTSHMHASTCCYGSKQQ